MVTYHDPIIKGRAGEKSRQLGYPGFTHQKQCLSAERCIRHLHIWFFLPVFNQQPLQILDDIEPRVGKLLYLRVEGMAVYLYAIYIFQNIPDLGCIQAVRLIRPLQQDLHDIERFECTQPHLHIHVEIPLPSLQLCFICIYDRMQLQNYI